MQAGPYSLSHELEDALVERELQGVHDEDAGSIELIRKMLGLIFL